MYEYLCVGVCVMRARLCSNFSPPGLLQYSRSPPLRCCVLMLRKQACVNVPAVLMLTAHASPVQRSRQSASLTQRSTRPPLFSPLLSSPLLFFYKAPPFPLSPSPLLQTASSAFTKLS